MIRVENLTRFYGERPAVEALSFHVIKGEVMGLLGPNGAGKTTTMRMLTCYIPPSSGRAWVDGVPIDHDSLKVRSKIGYLPEHAPSYDELTVCDHLRFIGRMHGLPRGRLADRMREVADMFGLNGVMHRRIQELSKGYRQRVGLAASLIHDPPCLILDEPTTGLDPNQIIEVRRFIRDLASTKTILISSHVLAEVETVCDRVLILSQGRLAACGSVDELAKMAQGGEVLEVVMKGNASTAIENLRSRMPDITVDFHEEGEECRAILRYPEREGLAEAMFHAAVEAGAVILEMRRKRLSLEDVFRELTGRQA